MSFVDFLTLAKEAAASARGLRQVGPYVHDGARWRRPTRREQAGLWLNAFEATAFAPSPFLRMLKKGKRR